MTGARITAYIGIGANLGNARASVEKAIQQLDTLPATRLTGQSCLFRTAPIDAGGDDYINAAARIETRLQPGELLQELQLMEQAAGRERRFVNAPRTLDLDILLFGSQEISTELLTVPHPRLTQRAFALIPLLQIDPLIAIPGKGPAHSFVTAVAGQVICKI
ncbi:MAG: 2-amino-4-hydroxy-6-hydroxymethyldihydropteridine diphosphokinase [Burkholderiales bacterium RIFCSPLOWO2_02_FULL_57_36]|nr:MAG: 2-amino-4-hydroxy-6-hydroxymethyldihydropteridine diphosphokinase [Burkholderiales bacterium RIFCSPLOWO2_02_FULL_57_36]